MELILCLLFVAVLVAATWTCYLAAVCVMLRVIFLICRVIDFIGRRLKSTFPQLPVLWPGL